MDLKDLEKIQELLKDTKNFNLNLKLDDNTEITISRNTPKEDKTAGFKVRD